jgi:hypothetical protein
MPIRRYQGDIEFTKASDYCRSNSKKDCYKSDHTNKNFTSKEATSKRTTPTSIYSQWSNGASKTIKRLLFFAEEFLFLITL